MSRSCVRYSRDTGAPYRYSPSFGRARLAVLKRREVLRDIEEILKRKKKGGKGNNGSLENREGSAPPRCSLSLMDDS